MCHHSKWHWYASGVVLLAALTVSGATSAEEFQFAVVGDQLYNPASEAQFPNIMEEIDRADVEFVVYVGDFKGGNAPPCSDELYQTRRQQFDDSTHPFVYTPGDNEWTDCHHEPSGGFDPVERLAKLREIFFTDDQSLGKTKLKLTRQSDNADYAKFSENALWTNGGILFATLDVTGENNNLGRAPEADAEYRERNAADTAWLTATFERAARENNTAVVLFMQADPRFETIFPEKRIAIQSVTTATAGPSGYDEFLAALQKETLSFGKPVVLVHGDTHFFRVDKPMFVSGVEGPAKLGQQVENFTRLETFGFPEAHWVLVTVDTDQPDPFTFRPKIVEANIVKGP